MPCHDPTLTKLPGGIAEPAARSNAPAMTAELGSKLETRRRCPRPIAALPLKPRRKNRPPHGGCVGRAIHPATPKATFDKGLPQFRVVWAAPSSAATRVKFSLISRMATTSGSAADAAQFAATPHATH